MTLWDNNDTSRSLPLVRGGVSFVCASRDRQRYDRAMMWLSRPQPATQEGVLKDIMEMISNDEN